MIEVTLPPTDTLPEIDTKKGTAERTPPVTSAPLPVHEIDTGTIALTTPEFAAFA
jgi:hypothetical protein